MNASQIGYPARQQTTDLWTPLLAAVLLAIALVVGTAGIAALTARSGAISPVFVPQTINSHEHAASQPVYVPHTSLKVAAPAFVPQSVNSHDHPYNPTSYPQTVNSHDHDYIPTYRGVPFPYGVAGPSQLGTTTSLGVPFPGGVAGPSQLDRFHAPGMGGH